MPAIWVPISSVALAVCAAQRLDLLGHYGETLGRPRRRAARLDGGIEGEQVGLFRDGGG